MSDRIGLVEIEVGESVTAISGGVKIVAVETEGPVHVVFGDILLAVAIDVVVFTGGDTSLFDLTGRATTIATDGGAIVT